MLRDAAGFAGHDVGLAQRIEQRRLAVVDMAHDGDDRRTRLQRARFVRYAFQAFEHVGFRHALDGVAVFGGDEFGRVGVDHVVDLRHDAVLHQHLDDVDGAARHAVGEFGNGDVSGIVTSRGPADRGRLLLSGAVHALQMAAIGRDRTRALVVVGQRLGDGELASAARIGRLARNRGRLRRSGLAAGAGFLAPPSSSSSICVRVGRARVPRGRASVLGALFFLLETARGFFFGVTARGFVGGLARVFFGFALFGGGAFARQLGFFDGAGFRVCVGTLARFGFCDARIGKRAAAGFFSSSVS